MCSCRVAVFVCLASLAPLVTAQADDHPAKVELLANVASIKPGQPFTIGIRVTMQPHWHVYWLNPGDSGMPPQVTWKLPEGFTVAELQFPVPKKFEQPGDMVGYGYEEEVLLTANVTPPKDLKQGTTVPIAADLSWMVCKEVCLLGEAKPSIVLPVSSAAVPSNAELFENWQRQMPSRPTAVGKQMDMSKSELSLSVQLNDVPRGNFQWFPPASDQITFSDARVTRKGERVVITCTFKLVTKKQTPDRTLHSLLAYDAGDGTRRAVLVPFDMIPGRDDVLLPTD
jgi:thiol:disulfide interchange protein DsbD